ncbi:IcmF-related, N-terminal domain containing protein [Oxalobacteraceae bacterium]
MRAIVDNSFSIVWIAVLLVTVVTVLVIALRYGIDRSSDKSGARRIALDSGRLRSSFRAATSKIEANIVSHDKRYDIPWVVLLHDGSTNARPAVEACGLSQALLSEIEAPSDDAPRWHLFDRGVVVELSSDQLDDPTGPDAQEKRWEEFVALCGKYRPQRPLDSMIVSISASLLLDRTPQGRERLRERADAISRRIWIAQNRYAMRFAVYVVISGAEDIPGFDTLALSLPDALRHSMLGWSSPYQPAAMYQANWTTQAFDQIEQDVADISAELFASHTDVPAPADLFLLPSRIAALRAGAADYLQALMQPNAFHDPFFLRGIYLSGNGHQPFFLRDFLDEKVFAEFGLSRAAHAQKLSRPLLGRVFRWVAVGIPLIFGLGILISNMQLNRTLPYLAEGLEGLNRDKAYRTDASNKGERIDFEWYRKTALSLMIGLEQLQSKRVTKNMSIYDGTLHLLDDVRSGATGLLNPFMPGSWPMFDDLLMRAYKRIEQDFAELGLQTIQHAIYRRTTELTNAPSNPTTYMLSGGPSDCDPPFYKTTVTAGTLYGSMVVENLSEFNVLSNYVQEINRLSFDVGAIQRLKSLHRDSQRELRMLVLDTLGAELPGDLHGSLTLFRTATARETSLIDQQAIERATQCSFVKGTEALNRKLFIDNPLIRSEERIQSALGTVTNLFDGQVDPSSAEMIAAYKGLFEALLEQKTLLAQGHGGWMANDTLNLGESHEKILQQFADNKLIGTELVEQARRKQRQEHARLRQRYISLFGDGSDIIVAGNGKLIQSKNRQAMLPVIEHFLSQPFMTPAIGDALVATQRGTILRWDNEQLTKAVRLGESHKKFIIDELPKFPAEMQESVSSVIDFQHALRLVDLISRAFSPIDAEDLRNNTAVMSLASFELTSGHVKRLIAILKDLGQDTESRTLQTILGNDAGARLQMLNKELLDERPYQIVDEADDGKTDQRSMLNLFAGGDVPEYLNQQFTRMQSMSAHVQILRGTLPAEMRNSSDMARWNGISRELDLYTAKDPKGSLIKLERFMIDLGRELDSNTCLNVLKANEPPKRPNNYFADRHVELHKAITRRCLSLDRRSFTEQWTSFATEFNRVLKGRRPFIGNRSGIKASDYAATSAADFSETAALLMRLPVVSPEVLARNNVPEGSIAPIRDFHAQLLQVRQLLGPLFPTDASQPAAYDVSLRFRTNVNAEIDGNKIIDWTITMGEQTLKLRDPPRPIRWKAGDPIRLTLRFANDVPLLPRADPDNAHLEVSRKQVVFRFDGPWALLEMMQLLRVAEASDARTSALKFDIPVQNDSKDTALRAKPVRVFVGVTLSEPGKTAPLPWPAVFPERAPLVER